MARLSTMRPNLVLVAASLGCALPALADTQVPRMYYADATGAAVDTKDPAVVHYNGSYWMYYSQNGASGWQVAVAKSDNMLDWTYQGTLRGLMASGTSFPRGSATPGARVINGRVELFAQNHGGSGQNDIYHVYSTDGFTFRGGSSTAPIIPTGSWNNGRAIDADPLVIGSDLYMYWATRNSSGSVQQQGVSKATVGSNYDLASSWTQLNPSASILTPKVRTSLDISAGLSASALTWEGSCIEAAATVQHNGHVYMFYGGNYNNSPQQIGVAVSDDGVSFQRMNGVAPVLGPGAAGSWNASESGHPFVFHDDDGKDYLFYQGDNTSAGYKWRLSMVPIKWTAGSGSNPDVPSLDFAAVNPGAVGTAFTADKFATRTIRGASKTPFNVSTLAGALDGKVVSAGAATTGSTPSADAPQMTYSVNFAQTGAYHLYARLSVNGTSGDSLFVDTSLGSATETVKLVEGLSALSSDSGFFWVDLSTGKRVDTGTTVSTAAIGTLNVAAAGLQDFTLYGRDTSVYLDSFVFSQNANMTTSALVAAVPEPTAISMVIGLGMVLGLRRRA